MSYLFVYIRKCRLTPHALALAALAVSSVPLSAATFTSSSFATGTAVSSTAPDSVTYGNGSLWIEYGNGASSSDYTGKSTIVQYSTSGTMQKTYSIPGSVDGLKYNPTSGSVWALQNQDGQSQLSIINPATSSVSSFTYGAPYSSTSGRGFDDVAFIGSKVFMSETNPTGPSDPVVVQLSSATPASPLTVSSVLTGAGITATDPDSLKSTPAGGLVLTGEGDGTLTFITDPGLATQSAHTVTLSGAGGSKIGHPDDSYWTTATAGTFYVTDTSANTVYAISASGLTPNSLFVNVGNEFGSVDPSTGVITSILTGTGLHGIEFVPSATAAPEPATLGISLIGISFGLLAVRRRKGSVKQ